MIVKWLKDVLKFRQPGGELKNSELIIKNLTWCGNPF